MIVARGFSIMGNTAEQRRPQSFRNCTFKVASWLIPAELALSKLVLSDLIHIGVQSAVAQEGKIDVNLRVQVREPL